MRVIQIMNRKTDVLKVVLALRAARCFARRLNGRQKKRDQDANDRDHDEQLD